MSLKLWRQIHDNTRQEVASSEVLEHRVYHGVQMNIHDICVRSTDEHGPMGRCEVLRTALEVESHEPDPQGLFDEVIGRHPKIAKPLFKAFLKNGRPPPGTVLVEWSKGRIQLVPESELALLYRPMQRGEEVKLRNGSPLIGVVNGYESLYNLVPYTKWSFQRAIAAARDALLLSTPDLLQSTLWPSSLSMLDSDNPSNLQSDSGVAHSTIESEMESAMLGGVSRLKLTNGVYPPTNSIIIHQGWIGVIHDADDMLDIRLPRGGIIRLNNENGVYSEEGSSRARQICNVVQITRSALRQCEIMKGPFQETDSKIGVIVRRTAYKLHIDWVKRRGDYYTDHNEPPPTLSADLLSQGVAKIWDKRNVPVGDRCLFRFPDHDYLDCREFMKVVDDDINQMENKLLAMQGRITDKELSDRGSQHVKDAMANNTFHHYSAFHKCTVRWQDGTETRHLSEELEAVIEVTDENVFHPGDVVVPQIQKPSVSEATWRPEQVGVVQSSHPSDRVAMVMWQKCDDLQFVLDSTNDDILLHGDSVSGLPLQTESLGKAWLEEVPVYDIMVFPGSKFSLGEYVTVSWPKLVKITALHQRNDTNAPTCSCSVCQLVKRGQSDQIDWFGQVMENRTDGLTIVRFGAMDIVEDHALPIEALEFAFSLGHYQAEQDEMDELSSISGYNNRDTDSDEEMEMETWIENEAGERVQSTNDGGDDEHWDTVSEHYSADDSDVQMVDDDDPKLLAKLDAAVINEQQMDQKHVSAGVTNRQYHARPSLIGETAPDAYILLDTAPASDHKYLLCDTGTMTGARIKRITKEHGILAGSLPEGVFVRGWESRLDLLRILIVGPVGTPYEHCPFLFDLQLGVEFPHAPPIVHFYSWTHGSGRVNPNLYEAGKICLSLLNTWFGEQKSEGWNPNSSTVLQVIVSLLGLVLVKEPYYNEAGYDARSGSSESALISAHYSEKAFYSSRGFIKHAIENEIDPFNDVIKWLYIDTKEGAPQLLRFVVEDLKTIVAPESTRQHSQIGGLENISRGAIIVLRRRLTELEDVLLRLST